MSREREEEEEALVEGIDVASTFVGGEVGGVVVVVVSVYVSVSSVSVSVSVSVSFFSCLSVTVTGGVERHFAARSISRIDVNLSIAN